VPDERRSFAPFPVPEDLLAWEPTDGDYVYLAGIAHRDGQTLLVALRATGWPAVLAARWDLERTWLYPRASSTCRCPARTRVVR
jgi:hypothetical protein